jgi:hypothetical protein
MLNRLAATFAILFFCFLFTGCSNSDDNPINDLNSDVFTDADPALLVGTWSIFSGSLNGQSVPVPPTSPNCGRDYFVYNADGSYSDFVFFDSGSCTPEVSNLSWSLSNGIITLRDNTGATSDVTITNLTSSTFVFKAAVDFDFDGDDDIFTFTARPYDPPAIGNVSFTFQQNSAVQDRIEFNWTAYNGGVPFDRYEIYRSLNGCDKTGAELIATITDQNVNSFIDETPGSEAELCYYFKVYTERGELGESILVTVFTDTIEVPLVTIDSAIPNGEVIDLLWLPYTGFYFSHYEIYVRNFVDGTSGYAFQSVKIAEIDDPQITSFTDNAPPFVQNPIYEVRAVNTFGNTTQLFATGGFEVTYERAGLLDLDFVNLTAYDPDDSTVFFLGSLASTGEQKLLRYDYNTRQTTISSSSPNTSSEVFMKIIGSGEGKELLLSIGSDIHVYDAATLDFKYRLERDSGFLFPTDFAYLDNGVWVFTDNDKLYTLSRSGGTYSVIAEAYMNASGQNAGLFQVIPIGNGRVLTGHEGAETSYTFDILANGQITNQISRSALEWKDYKKTFFYNSTADLVLDTELDDVFDAQNFSTVQNVDRPNILTALNLNGTLVLGTDNDPEWTIDEDSMHSRKAFSFGIGTAVVTEQETIGYPHLVFENNAGQRVSISSWFKREGLRGSAPRPDLFVEVLN